MGDRGFTLVEMLVVTLILSLLILSLSGILIRGFQAFSYQNNKIELQQNLRYALYTIIEEIKNAHQVIKLTDDELTLLNRKNELITYKLAIDPQRGEHLYQITGRNLYRYTIKGKEPIANFIKSLSFCAYPDDEGETDITYVEVSIQGMTPKGKTIKLNTGAGLKWRSFGSLVKEN